jgi:hypothetical protein
VPTARDATRLRSLLKKYSCEHLIPQIPGLAKRGKGGFDYRALLEVVEYCVRYLVRDYGMKRREAIREVSGTIWKNLSGPGQIKTSKNKQAFARRLEELLLSLKGREVTFELPRHAFCIPLFAGSILFRPSTFPQEVFDGQRFLVHENGDKSHCICPDGHGGGFFVASNVPRQEWAKVIANLKPKRFSPEKEV